MFFDVTHCIRSRYGKRPANKSAICDAAVAEAARRGKSAEWVSLEPGFRDIVSAAIAEQREAVTERLAARLQDRDRRQNLTTCMSEARKLMDAEWGDGSAWCDAKKVLSAARAWLQSKGIPAQALTHKNIIAAMTNVPADIVKLVKALVKLARSDASPARRKPRRSRRARE